MKSKAQTPSSSRPSVGATVAPIAETPVAEVPVAEAPVAETPITEAPVDETQGAEAPVAPSSTPAPMETGRVGNGQSWAEQVEAGEDEAFQRSRPVKHARSQLRRHGPKPPLPFPLWDSEGRLTSISQLYAHVEEQPIAQHNVAGNAIMHLHPEMLPQNARCLGNQVACMIVEYHLTASAQGLSTLSPIVPQEAAALLPVLKHYVPGVAFKGTRDVRVVDCQDPLGSCLATLAGYGHGRRGAGLRDFGGLAALSRPTPGVIFDSEDQQPHFPGGC